MSHDDAYRIARDPTTQAQRAPFLQQLAEANELRSPHFNCGDLWDWTPAERGNELAGEVGELCNILKKMLRLQKRFGLKVERDGCVTGGTEAARNSFFRLRELATEELGDGVICLSLIARQLGIDLEAATRQKFNATSDKIGSGVKL